LLVKGQADNYLIRNLHFKVYSGDLHDALLAELLPEEYDLTLGVLSDVESDLFGKGLALLGGDRIGFLSSRSASAFRFRTWMPSPAEPRTVILCSTSRTHVFPHSLVRRTTRIVDEELFELSMVRVSSPSGTS